MAYAMLIKDTTKEVRVSNQIVGIGTNLQHTLRQMVYSSLSATFDGASPALLRESADIAVRYNEPLAQAAYLEWLDGMAQKAPRLAA